MAGFDGSSTQKEGDSSLSSTPTPLHDPLGVEPNPAFQTDNHITTPRSATVSALLHPDATLPLPDSHLTYPLPANRPHIRTPSAAGLSLQTDLSMLGTNNVSHLPNNPTIVESKVGEQLRGSASTPIAIQENGLRNALSTMNMASSLSPSSAVSSPALNALTDITPLPSPLAICGDSPGPWSRAGAALAARRGSRGSFTGSKEDLLGGISLKHSPSKKKKDYQELRTAAVEAAGAANMRKNEVAHRKNRSLSELAPEQFHNIRPRHVTISGTGQVHSQIEHVSDAQLHREAYLAAQRGLVTVGKTGLPTPPASNRSLTESEGEETFEDDGIKYLAVRHAPAKAKRLWRPVRQLGQGTFSKVFLATSEKIAARDPLDEATLDPRQLVAIKVVEHGPAGGADEERVELSLKREVEMLRSVSHPSLVHLRAFDHDDAHALLVLTYCPGGDLFDVASEHRDILGPDMVQRMFAELVDAVRYLHSQWIVHRDIKLENVLLNIPLATAPLLKGPQNHHYPLVTLTDLGLSRRIPEPPASPLLATRCGSEDYAAPEILLGQPYDGRATDAWALGVLLYALMEGRLPFDPLPGKSRSRAVHRIARCDWVWCQLGDQDGEWDEEKGKPWGGARECVEGLLKKVSRGRKSLDEIATMEWVVNGIKVDGGIKRRIEDEDIDEETGEISSR